MKHAFTTVLIIVLCGTMLLGCGVQNTDAKNSIPAATVLIQPTSSPVVTQKSDISNLSATIPATSITLSAAEIEIQKRVLKPVSVPVAYISIDINPSIELGVDSIDNVITAEAYNADGKKVLSACIVIGLNVKDAVKLLVAEASKQGFIAADGSTVISITTETIDKNKADNLKKLSEAGALQALDDCNDCASVYKDNVELSIRAEAKALGISYGKLILINKLIALDLKATIEQYKNTEVSEIIKKIKLLSGTKYNALMNDDVDCSDGCMDDCSCVDCSDCKDDHCDVDCSDGCKDACICTDCNDCKKDASASDVSGATCTDSCSDDCSCSDCEDCDDALDGSDCKDCTTSNCSCKDCKDCGGVVVPANNTTIAKANKPGTNNVGNNASKDAARDAAKDAADQLKDAAEEKADQEMDRKEGND
jgi:hypothetical protein